MENDSVYLLIPGLNISILSGTPVRIPLPYKKKVHVGSTHNLATFTRYSIARKAVRRSVFIHELLYYTYLIDTNKQTNKQYLRYLTR